MDRTTTQLPADQQPYVRPSAFEVEPAMFALALIAVTFLVHTWAIWGRMYISGRPPAMG